MMTIITTKKIYYWNYKRLALNLWNIFAISMVIAMYLFVSTMEYNGLVK